MALHGDLEGHNLHLFGIGGRGMAPLALVAQRLGAGVGGCDRAPQPTRLDELTGAGIVVTPGHDTAHIVGFAQCSGPDSPPVPDRDSVTALVATSVAPSSHPEIAMAAQRGILHHRTDLLAACLRARPGIGVTGSHGKGTVAALTAAALIEAGLDPLTLIGVDAPAAGGIARPGLGPLVAEVDDSDLTLRGVATEVAVVTNLDRDHPQLQVSLRDSVEAVGAFVGQARRLVIIGPTPRGADLAGRATAPVWRYGQEFKGRLRSAEGGRSEVTVTAPGVRQDVTLHLLTPRAHVNAAIALAAAVALGADPEAAARGLGRLDRIDRRMEAVGERDGVRVYDDFGAKHPCCVRGGIGALRQHFPVARVVAVFEPWDLTLPPFGYRYARALSGADRVVLAPPAVHPDYPHSAPPDTHWWAHCSAPVTATASREDASAEAMAGTSPGDVVIFFVSTPSRGMALAAVAGSVPAQAPGSGSQRAATPAR